MEIIRFDENPRRIKEKIRKILGCDACKFSNYRICDERLKEVVQETQEDMSWENASTGGEQFTLGMKPCSSRRESGRLKHLASVAFRKFSDLVNPK